MEPEKVQPVGWICWQKKHVRVHVWIQHRLQYMIIDYIVNIIIYYYSYYSYLFLIPHMGRWPNPTIECFCFFWDVMGWNMLKPRLEGSPLADVEHRRACLAKQTCYQNQWNRCWISRKLEESSLSMTLWYPMHVGVSRICCSVLLLCLGLSTKMPWSSVKRRSHGHVMRHVIRHVMDEPIVTSQVHFLERVTICHNVCTAAWFVSPWYPLHVGANLLDWASSNSIPWSQGLILCCGQTWPNYTSPTRKTSFSTWT